MIDDPAGRIDYDETGAGPAIVLVPGSCSTGAAWRPVIAALGSGVRAVTTSLLGYGGTAERRSATDTAIAHEVAILEAVIRRAGGPVHLVGHSYGGLVSLAVALAGRVPLASLTVAEAPAMEILSATGETEPYAAFRRMNADYAAAFAAGDREAIRMMIDFYGGDGTYAAFPPRVRAYAMETTAVNLLDWQTAFGFPLPPAALARLALPVLVLHGGNSHPAVARANALLSRHIPDARLAVIDGAAHFMIATHAHEVAAAVKKQL